MGLNTSDWLRVTPILNNEPTPLNGNGDRILVLGASSGNTQREALITVITNAETKYISVFREGDYYYSIELSSLIGFPGDIISVLLNTNLPSTASTFTVTGPGTFNQNNMELIINDNAQYGDEITVTAVSDYDSSFTSTKKIEVNVIFYYNLILSKTKGVPSERINVLLNTNLPSTASTFTVTGPATYSALLDAIVIDDDAEDGDEITVTAISNYDSSYQDSGVINVEVKDNVYVKFETTGSNRLYFYKSRIIGGTVEYSTDGIYWIAIDGNIYIDFDSSAPLYFRGKNPNGFVNDSGYSPFELNGNTGVTISGNIMSLIDYETLPNVIPSIGCFANLFINSTKIVNVDKNFLPATGLTARCYTNMFYGCTSLLSAPDLPATTLEINCYNNMFADCSSLVMAPELPATTLVQGCYETMFVRCSSLNYIKCLASNISARNCVRVWVSGVSSTGTFVKKTGMTSWPSGTSGIPNNWTVIDN